MAVQKAASTADRRVARSEPLSVGQKAFLTVEQTAGPTADLKADQTAGRRADWLVALKAGQTVDLWADH